MSQLERILIPLDGSEVSEQALGLAQAIRAGGSVPTLLRVVDSAGETSPATRYLEELADQAPATGASILVRRSADPARQILSEVEQGGHDLLVLVTHGLKGVLRWLRHSVAEQVLRRCPIPLLLGHAGGVGLPATGARKVLVPLAEDEAATDILPLVLSICRSAEAEVVLLSALEVEAHYNPLAYVRELDAAIDAARERLQAQAAKLRSAGVRASTRVVMGSPTQAILRAADELGVDLIAMTNHARSPVERWLFGSVAEEVARACPQAVLLVPARTEGLARARAASYAAG